MTTFSQNDITLLFVGKSSTALSTGGIETLNDGELGLFTPGGTRIVESSAALGDEFVIAQGRGDESPIVSPKLSSEILQKSYVTTYVAPTEKVDYIGFNGTSGSIDSINDNLYYVRLEMDVTLDSSRGKSYVKHGVYKSDTSALQREVADGITKSIITNFSREPEKQLKAERVTNSTATANPGSITADVKNGVKAIELSGTFAEAQTIGNYVLIDDIAYKIANVTGTTVFIDTPYQGATGTIAAGDLEAITEANADSGDWGIKLTGLPLDFKVGKINYRKSNWVTSIEGFGNTVLTNDTIANPGVGSVEQAKELEWFLRGNNGEFYRMGEPNIHDRITDVANENYEFLQLSSDIVDGTMTQVKFKRNFTLLIPEATPAFYSANPNGLQRTLEILLFGSVTGDLAL